MYLLLGNGGNFSVEATIDKLEKEFAMIDKPNGLLVGVGNGSSDDEIFGAKERQRYEQVNEHQVFDEKNQI